MGTDLLSLLKRVVELAMPNLRNYYRIVRKARVVATYASDGSYWADVQPLRNDESVDENEPVIPKVEIPILWAGPLRGVVCPPLPGTYCDLTYYDGDPDYPRISNFRWYSSDAPDCEVDGFIIQQTPGVHIKIDAQSNIIHFTPANRINEIGGSRNEQIGRQNTRVVEEDEAITIGGNKAESVKGNWTIEVSGQATIRAPQINLVGNLSATGCNGGVGKETKHADTTHYGSVTLNGPLKCTSLEVTDSVNIGGNLRTTGNSYAGSRSGGIL